MNRKERRAAMKQGRLAPAAAPASPAPSAALFEQAIRLHQAGQWAESDALCRAIVAREPGHVGSLHLIGVIAQQHGRFDEAAGFFRKVIAIKPDIAVVHLGLGGALAAAGQAADAVLAFEQGLALKRLGPEDARLLLNLGNLYNQLGRGAEAARCYGQALTLRPDYAEAHNSLGSLLLAQGRQGEAAGHFARALELEPELFQDFASVSATLRAINPVLDRVARRAVEVWPTRLPPGELLTADTLGALAGDPVLRCMLESVPLRDLDLEKFFTGLRAALLGLASEMAGDADVAAALVLSCVLARQCFVNEYIFADTPEELEQVEQLKRKLADAIAEGRAVPPLWLAVIGSYGPLAAVPELQSLPSRAWPQPVTEVLTQQVREVEQERQLRDTIPRLTAIGDAGSALVRQQYEENPYPRWVRPPSLRPPLSVDDHLRAQLPWATFRPLGERESIDILVAGCGTGEHPIGVARRYRGARVLAIDLSLNSLCYAKRKTAELGLQNIEYAQADILELGALGRSFDLIDAGGVLHHLADPAAGWRQLLALLRPRGLMRIALYSEIARADVVAARSFIAERGFGASAAEIRRCRQELLDTSLRALARYRDFFSTSECRDLLFHVQEQRLSIPQLKQFLAAQNLKFIGFELDGAVAAAYRARYPGDPSMTDLDCWHVFESERPATFSAMYQFWVQRA